MGKTLPQRRDRRKNYPIEWVALIILEYLVEKAPRSFSVNHLMRLKGIGWQRRDRVRWIIGRFEGLGWVKVASGSNRRTDVGRYYSATEGGTLAYEEIGRNLLLFLELFRFGEGPPSRPGEPESFRYGGDGIDT